MPPASGLARVLFVDADSTATNPDGSLNNPYKKIQTAVDRHAQLATTTEPWEDWTILIAPGEYDESVNITGPVRLALIGLGAFRLGHYKVDASNLVPKGPAQNIVWTYHASQRINGGPIPQLVIGMVGGTDVVRHGKPIANLISGSIIVQGTGWDDPNLDPPLPSGGTAFLGISHTQVNALSQGRRPVRPSGDSSSDISNVHGFGLEPTHLTDLIPVAIDATGAIEPFQKFTGVLVDRHFNCRFKGAILGPVTTAKTPGYVIATSFMSQYEGLVQVTRFTSTEQCGLAAGLTVALAPNIDTLFSVVPPGMVNSTFAGPFNGPPGSLLLDAATNTWFVRNGATLEGPATKAFLDGALQALRINSDRELTYRDCGVTLLVDTSTQPVSIRLPSAAGRDDLTFTIKNIATPAQRSIQHQLVLVLPQSGETIDGGSLFLLSKAEWYPAQQSDEHWPSGITIVANSGAWWVVGSA